MSKTTKQVPQPQPAARIAVIYARVSSDEQAREGKTSLGTQISLCQAYADANGLTVPTAQHIITDDYTGTVPIEQRPGGRRAYDMLENGQADALIAYRMDRIVRPPEEGDEWDIPVLVRGLSRLGKEIHLTNRGRISTSFADLLIAMLDAKSAGDERRAFVERARLGHLAKAKSGRIPGKGKHPIGLRYSDGAYHIHEPEARLVRDIFHLYLYGDENGQKMSLRAVAAYYTGLKQPSPHDLYGQPRKSTPSGLWHINTVRRILTNPVYMGEFRYHSQDMDSPVIVPVPAIVDPRDWQRVQTRLKLNGEYAFRNSAPDRYILRGMIRCATCDHVFIGKTKGKGLTYYGPNCSAGQPQHIAHEKLIRASVIESAAWDYVLHIIIGDDLEALLLDMANGKRKLDDDRQSRLSSLDQDIAEVEREAFQLAEAVVKVGSGLVGAALQKKIDTANERHAALVRQRNELAAVKPALSGDDISAYLALREKLADRIENATPADKRRKFEQIELSVKVKDGLATITSVFPVVFSNVNLHPPRNGD